MEKEHIRVLLVEDNPGDARLVQELLAEATGVQFDAVWAQRLDEGIEQKKAGEFDVVLLDLGLPDSSGLETYQNMYFAASESPIVVLTGQDDQELGITALQAGAQDYLPKGLGLVAETLVRTLRYAVERHRQQNALDEIKDMLLQAQAAENVGVEIREPLGTISKIARKLSQQLADDHPQRALVTNLSQEIQRIEDIVGNLGELRKYGVEVDGAGEPSEDGS